MHGYPPQGVVKAGFLRRPSDAHSFEQNRDAAARQGYTEYVLPHISHVFVTLPPFQLGWRSPERRGRVWAHSREQYLESFAFDLYTSYCFPQALHVRVTRFLSTAAAHFAVQNLRPWRASHPDTANGFPHRSQTSVTKSATSLSL